MKLEFFLLILKDIFFKWITIISYSITDFHNFYIYLKSKDYLNILVKMLKKCMFLRISVLTDTCIIDKPSSFKRYELIYNLLSIMFNLRIFIKVYILENNVINSLSNNFLNSIWIEREVWDMFGIIFINNMDLRRILSDYSFEGYPLKKDFPLTGFVELQYDDNLLALKYVPVELAQDYRVFTFSSPWEDLIL